MLERGDRLRDLEIRRRQHMPAAFADERMDLRVRLPGLLDDPACRTDVCRHRTVEAVTGTRDGLDVAAGVSTPKSRPQARDVHGENALLDVRARPHIVEQLLLVEEMTRLADQGRQHVERLRLERDDIPAFHQPALRHVERAVVEEVRFVRQGFGES